jgi:Activator of Hsp90 ATPase homolog 1-like protein
VIEPLRLSFDLACSQEHAFSTWTERIGDWWPRSHSVSGDPARVVLEPRLGGRLYERTSTGDEIAWGEVTVWEPPRRLGYLWHLRRDRTDATDVEITFTERGERATRVEIEHRGWERLGDGASWRERNQQAWSTLLPHYEEAIER